MGDHASAHKPCLWPAQQVTENMNAEMKSAPKSDEEAVGGVPGDYERALSARAAQTGEVSGGGWKMMTRNADQLC